MAVSPNEAALVAKWMAARAAHRLYVAHLAECGDCLWDLCPEGRRLERDADEREGEVPPDAYRALSRRHAALAEHRERRWPVWAAIAVFALTGLALMGLPFYAACCVALGGSR